MLISISSSLVVTTCKLDGDMPAIVIKGDSTESVNRVAADIGSTLS